MNPPPTSAEVKSGVDLYFYYPSGRSRPLLGWPLPFYLSFMRLVRIHGKLLNILVPA